VPTFKLDDKDIAFEAGDTVIRAAHRAGIDIPHYCWHPGLSIAANCRMCLVELLPPPGRKALLLDVLRWDSEKHDYVVEQKPKLVPACQQAVAEGMEVRSATSQHAEQARGSVQEMLLLNHPVDCPICDQAGECRLQDYWLEHQRSKKRMRDEPVHKPKAVVFGPTIVYDAERCILCTRCIRVSDELARDPVLSIRERGNLGEIVVAPGRQLDHAYTLMTEYVCPVGALTAVDFRFKARVWFLRSVESVCVGCATGCNSYTDYDPRDQKVYRYRPRENLAVNKYWMCDDGMLDYQRIHSGRVLRARLRGKTVNFDVALKKAAGWLKLVKPEKLAVVFSAQHSSEDNFALLILARDHLATPNLFMSGKAPGPADDILRHPDKNPNTRGVMALCGSALRPFVEFSKALNEGQITHVLALGSYLGAPEQVVALKAAQTIVTLATHEGPFVERAEAVLPVSSWAECDGTFVSAKGLVQASEKAVVAQGDSLPGWKVVAMLGRALGFAMPWQKLREVRAEMEPLPNRAAGALPLNVGAGAAE